MHHERGDTEVKQQVLAPASDEDELVAVCDVGRGTSGLEHRNRERREPFQHGRGEAGVEPFSMGLDLGELGQGP